MENKHSNQSNKLTDKTSQVRIRRFVSLDYNKILRPVSANLNGITIKISKNNDDNDDRIAIHPQEKDKIPVQDNKNNNINKNNDNKDSNIINSDPKGFKDFFLNIFMKRKQKFYTHFHHYLWIFLYCNLTVLLMIFYFLFEWKNYISLGDITVANLLLDVIIRNELFITLLHRIVVFVPLFKYFFNRMVHSIGGIHIGCGISITAWFFLNNIFIDQSSHMFIKVSTLVLLIFLFIIIVTAIPPIRKHNHNLFEKFHRYLGWLTLSLLLVHVIIFELLSDGYVTVYKNPSILMTFIITGFIIHPWLFVRRVHVELNAPSSQCTVISIDECKQTRYHGRFLRISKNLREWHSFAVALSYPNERKIKVIVAAAGDWTNDLIKRSSNDVEKQNLNKLWIRRIFGTGFMYSINAYKKVLIIATGSGIAPVLPYVQTPSVDSYIIWIASDHAKNYGSQLLDLFNSRLPKCRLHDTKKNGRPSPQQIIDWFREQSDLEAVFVVSNPKFTYESIYVCLMNNIPCYGATWDS